MKYKEAFKVISKAPICEWVWENTAIYHILNGES